MGLKAKLQVLQQTRNVFNKFISFWRNDELKQVSSQCLHRAEKNGIPSVFSGDIEEISDLTLRESFAEYSLGVLKKSNAQNSNNLWRIQTIAQKLNMCTDVRIKNEAEYLLLNARSKSIQDFEKAFDKVEQLLDCANTMEGKYSSLFRNPSVASEYYKDLAGLKSKGDIEVYRDYAYSDIRRLSRPIETNGLDGSSKVISANIDKQAAEYIAKNQDIKEYIATASKDDSMAKALYRKYLETQPKDIRYKLEDIYSRYGIHTFVDNNASKNTLSKLERLEYELQQQLKTSDGNVEFPNLLDITKYDDHFISCGAGGYAYRGGRYKSKLAIEESSDIATVYRHESVHYNDKRLDNERPHLSEASIKDFGNGELTIDNIMQIMTSRAEKIAHSSELEMTKVSQTTKDELINDGLKPFYTKMESIKEGNENFLYEQFFLRRKKIKSLIQHSKYGADEKFVLDLLKNKDKLDFRTIEYLYEKNPEYKFCDIEELLMHISEYKANFTKNISAFFDKTAVEKIQNNPYINKNELLNYIKTHKEDREIINEIINEYSPTIKVSDFDLLLGCKKSIRNTEEWLKLARCS